MRWLTTVSQPKLDTIKDYKMPNALSSHLAKCAIQKIWSEP